MQSKNKRNNKNVILLDTYKRIIIIIPSWYPSKQLPLYGTFVKEQAVALARHNQDHLVIVSLRSDVDVSLSLKNPIKIIMQYLRGSFLRLHKTQLAENIIEIESPAFTLRHGRKMFSALNRLFALSKRNWTHVQNKYGNIDIIHAHVGYPGGYVAALLSNEFNVPYVITEHMSNFPFKTYIKNNELIPELCFALNEASSIISVSNYSAKQIESYGFSAPAVIPNMVDEETFSPNASPTKYFTILSVGGLIERKGFEELIEAVSLWENKPENLQVLIVGNGPKRNVLLDKIHSMSLENVVKLVGSVSRDKIPDFFKQCDLFVLPSHLESFGVVYTEALACGKPVIATKCGGPSDIVNSNNGLLVDVKQPHQLAQAMRDIYENYSCYDPERIRKDFLSRFSSKAVADRITSLYEDVIKGANL